MSGYGLNNVSGIDLETTLQRREQVDIDDGLPQQMCARCVNFLNTSLKFRKQCKDSEARLLQLKNEYVTLTNSADEDVDDDFDLKEERLEVDEDSKIDDVNIKSEGDHAIQENQSDLPSYTPTNERPRRKRHATFKAEKITRIACTLCQKDLSVRSINAHMAKCHPGADEWRVKCELCDTHVMKDKMNRHIKMMHGNTELHCGHCKSVFDDKEVLVEHVASCTAKKKKRKISESGRELTQCDVCHKTMQRASLRSHVAVKHRGLGPVCEHCGRKFGNRLRLSEHLRAKHGHEKFKCQHCEFTSASIAALRNHERRHRGEKPFVCEQCGAKFHAAYLLAQHKQSHRTEKRVKGPVPPLQVVPNPTSEVIVET
ncbi:uncharacterized protein isoform X2 [Choristoneura fumiferana]|uniref:uncharacterized protein isoform X2 n=1 Tax=Choristoneura fumiferana TaxID=7141 RepID=UPI003D156ED8